MDVISFLTVENREVCFDSNIIKTVAVVDCQKFKLTFVFFFKTCMVFKLKTNSCSCLQLDPIYMFGGDFVKIDSDGTTTDLKTNILF